MKTLTIGFSSPRKERFFSRIVKLYQRKTDYSHVYVKLFDPEISEWIVYEASHGRLHAISSDNFILHNNVSEEFRLPISDETQKTIKVFCVDSLQKKSGDFTLLGLVLHKWFGWKLANDGDKRYICSEFGIRILEVAGFIDYKIKNPDFLSPLDLFRILEGIDCRLV